MIVVLLLWPLLLYGICNSSVGAQLDILLFDFALKLQKITGGRDDNDVV